MTRHKNDDFFKIDQEVTFDSPLLSELTEAIKKAASRPDPALALSSALMTLNLFAGREVVTPTHSSMIMYLIILAPTGYGKDRFIRAPGQIVEIQGQPGINTRMSISSVPALEKAFASAPIVYNQIDEIGNLFYRLTKARASNIEFSLDAVLKNKWGVEADDIDVTTETKDRDSNKIKYPILNIFGASTTEQLYGSLNKRALCDGFYNRFLIVESSNVSKNRRKQRLTLTPNIEDGLTRFNGLSPCSLDKHVMVIPQFEVPWNADKVEQRYFALEDEIEAIKYKSVDMHNLFVRLPEMALRIATLIAVSRDFQYARVTMQDLEFAINFVKKSGNISARYTQTMMADNAFEALRNRLLMKIELAGPEGMNGRDICRKLNISARVRDAALQDLLDQDYILVERTERPSKKNKTGVEQTIMYFSNSTKVQELLRHMQVIEHRTESDDDE